jgi:hypothetical protein
MLCWLLVFIAAEVRRRKQDAPASKAHENPARIAPAPDLGLQRITTNVAGRLKKGDVEKLKTLSWSL